MTTNHRPTLESKRGRANDIKDTIQHARSQTSQSSMKLRPDVKSTAIDGDLARKGLDELHPAKRLRRNEPELAVDRISDAEDPSGHPAIKTTEATESSKGSDISGSDTNNTDISGSDSSGSDSDDSDEEAELLRELAKIKKEKEEQKRQTALAGNPLIDSEGNDKTPKKSWRSSNRFGKKPQPDSDKQFTTNTLDSDVHRKFLSKYFR